MIFMPEVETDIMFIIGEEILNYAFLHYLFNHLSWFVHFTHFGIYHVGDFTFFWLKRNSKN